MNIKAKDTIINVGKVRQSIDKPEMDFFQARRSLL